MTPLAAFGLLGLAAQISQGSIQPLPPRAAGCWCQSQLKLAFTGLHINPQGFDHRSGLEPQISQIAAIGGHITDQQFAVGAQHQIGILSIGQPLLAGRCHHSRAGDQHLTRQHGQLIGHLPMQGPARNRHQTIQGSVGETQQAGMVWIEPLTA